MADKAAPDETPQEDRRREWRGYAFSGVLFLGAVGILISRLVGDSTQGGTAGSPPPPTLLVAQQQQAAAAPSVAARAAPASPATAPTVTRASGYPAPVAVTATIDVRQRYQRIEGFGAATAYYQNWIVSHPNKAALYDALFKELNLSILRLPNIYRPGKGPNFAKDAAEIARAAQISLGHPIPIMMSSWSPPAGLKNTASEKNGGTLATAGGKVNYAGFARYWHDALVAYRTAGIVPAYVSIQNEPDWKDTWETCLFRPQEVTEDGVTYASYTKALDAVYDSLKGLPQPPKLMGPETLGIGYGTPEKFLPPTDKAHLARVYGIAHHLYSGGTHEQPDSFNARMKEIHREYPGKPLFMTEFGRSNGFQTAWIIHNSLVEEGVSAYVYWAAIWPGPDTLITIDNPWKKEEWKNPDGFTRTDRYYGLKHYSAFIGPGYQRVSATAGEGPLKVSAFISPEGSRLVVVALNTGKSGDDLHLAFRGFTATSAEAYRTEDEAKGEKFARVSPLATGGTVRLPPHAIVTITLEGRGRKQ